MPADTVQLFVDGKVHDDWSSYELDSDLLIPADAWRVTLSLRSGRLPAAIAPGAPVEVRVGGERVMVGCIDDVGEAVDRDGVHFDIAGRDGAAVLLDCSAPIFTKQMVTLAEVVAAVVRELGVKNIRIAADKTATREKINVEPGESAWETLVHAAEANGLWPWFEPDGTLIVGGPDYEQPPVATLILRQNGRGNNVLSLARRRSIAGRYSEVTVYGQKRGTDLEQGKHNLKATERDTGVPWHRPKIVSDYEAESEAACRSRARKIISDSRLKGFALSVLVPGHRIVAPGQAADGQLWKAGQRVTVVSEPHGIEGDVFFLMARKFTGGRQQGPRTLLTLVEDRDWLLDAHPHKKKHRLGKNAAPLQIIDASHGAAS